MITLKLFNDICKLLNETSIIKEIIQGIKINKE